MTGWPKPAQATGSCTANSPGIIRPRSSFVSTGVWQSGFPRGTDLHLLFTADNWQNLRSSECLKKVWDWEGTGMSKQAEANECPWMQLNYPAEESVQALHFSRAPCEFSFRCHSNTPHCVCRAPSPLWRQLSARTVFLNPTHFWVNRLKPGGIDERGDLQG